MQKRLFFVMPRAFSGANPLGWSTVGLYLLLALWFGYVRLMRA